MARQVFFSFHYDGDILRVGQIRNSGVVLGPGNTACGFIDSAAWEKVKSGGDDAIRRWIDGQLHGTSVTVVLIGTETANRPWVNYEIIESTKRNSGLLIEDIVHSTLDGLECIYYGRPAIILKRQSAV